MEYAIQLILPIIGGLMLGSWLQKTYGFSALWTVGLGILGLILGIGSLYRQTLREQALRRQQTPTAPKPSSKKSLKAPHSQNAKINVDDLHRLYQQLGEHPPHEQPDLPPTLEQELNADEPEPPK